MIRPLLVPVIAFVSVAAGLASSGQVSAGPPFDLTGDWTVQVSGDITITCTASVEQTEADLSATLRCPGTVETPLTGAVNLTTRSLILNLDGEQGLAVELSGTVSADGNAVDGAWGWSADRLTGTFHAVRGATPEPVVDLNGDWVFETSGDNSTCPGHIQQVDTSVQLDLDCTGDVPSTMNGALDGRYLQFYSQGSYYASAFVSTDGFVMGGGWNAGTSDAVLGGPLAGHKVVDHTLDGDLTGDWTISITSGLLGTCRVAAQQAGSMIFAAFDCRGAGAWWMRGSIDASTGEFRVEGTAGSRGDYHAIISGVMNDDDTSFEGSFAATLMGSHQPYWSGGTLSGQQIDDSPSLMDVTGPYDIQLTSEFDEFVPCHLDLTDQQEVLVAMTTCQGVGSGSLPGTINPLTGKFTLHGPLGGTRLTLDGQATSSALSGTWNTDERWVLGCFNDGSAPCTRRLEHGYPPGDASCDMHTNSLDAALVLQYTAGLIDIESFCSSAVFDLQLRCCPVHIDATDAAIILQLSAGLLARLAG